MGVKAKLSVLGLYQWNDNIFADMAIPEGVDGEILTWKILEECSEMEVLYSDPDYMRASLYNWSSAMLPNWTKIQEALTAEYNPIWNKDGKITEVNEYGAIIQSGSESETGTGTGNGSTTTNEIDKVAGFNSDNTHTREERSGNGTQSTTTSTTTKGTTSNRQEAHTDKRSVIEQGNIGVTESSAMVRHEVELRQNYNIYKIITEDFKKHYCIMVY